VYSVRGHAGATTTDTFLARVQARKLVQWTLAYLALAWLLAQVFALVGEQFDWARGTQRLITLILALGALPALVITWFHGERGAQRITAAELVALTASIALAIGIGWAVVRNYPAQQEQPQAATPTASLDKRHVAVLPLANLGDPANAGFTDGVHDTLITQIAKVPGITVISRTSVMHWKDLHPTVGEIAGALGVGTVLEGSVQRAGDALRIQVQLIDAATDAHLWAEIYDRPAKDVFAVQSEIAERIAEQVQLRLAPAEREALQTRPTKDDEAWDHFVLGRAHAANQEDEAAADEFRSALAQDPEFALAQAELARALALRANLTNDFALKPGMWKEAEEATQRAESLAPQLPEAQLARGLLLYMNTRDFQAAEKVFRSVVAALPNDARAHQTFGWLLRRQGRWEEAATLFERAAVLDPRDFMAGLALRLALTALRDRAGVERALQRAEAAQPGDFWVLQRALHRYDFEGDARPVVETAEAYFTAHPRDFWTAGLGAAAALSLGEYPRAMRILDRVDWTDAELDAGLWILKGATGLRLGRQEAAQQPFDDLRARLDHSMREDPAVTTQLIGISGLAMIEALSGNRAAALARIAEADAVLPIEKDFVDGVVQWSRILFVPAMVGDREGTLRLLRRFLAIRSMVTPQHLWCSPWAADLRTDPDFRALLGAQGVDVTRDPGGRPVAMPP
jgi:TolB-like protein